MGTHAKIVNNPRHERLTSIAVFEQLNDHMADVAEDLPNQTIWRSISRWVSESELTLWLYEMNPSSRKKR